MSSKKLSPIFFDPNLQRWKNFKIISQTIGLVFSIIFGVLIISVLINPVLPSLGLPPFRVLPQTHHIMPGRQTQAELTKTSQLKNTNNNQKKKLKALQPSTILTDSAKITNSEFIAFYVNWDDTSFTSLKKNISHIDTLIPEWLHLSKSDGTITLDDPTKQLQTLTFIHENRPDLEIIPLVNNFVSERMEWEGNTIAQMLSSKSARGQTIRNLLNYVKSNNFAGISIDFENIPDDSQPNLIIFMSELFEIFHPLGLEVSQSVPIDDPNFNYQALAKYTDYLILMAYDEHWAEAEAGAIASQNWYDNAIKNRFAQLPPDKYIIAIGNYGYDWKENSKPATEISFQEAVQIAHESDGKISLDSKTLNPFFNYYDEKDKLHSVWFLDAVTTFNQMVTGGTLHPHGFALWRLGSEDPSIWSVVENRLQLDKSVAEELKVIHYGYDLDYEGEGEVLKVTAFPSNGIREIVYDPDLKFITTEKLISFASPYTITRWGGTDKKKIALTFDDGPDGTYTPQILDILHKYNVPATFFVIGSNGNQYPGLLKRIINEGHEIGSHTYTHPDISTITDEQLSIELNATQRLLESSLGRRTVLFRPPYAEDVEPETPDQVRPLLSIGNQGYYTIGMQIDPDDWRNPGVDKIVNEVIEQASNRQGNIVLLHDSGGNRSQTVMALPTIIEGLRAKGFQLVAVSDLIGVSHEAVMPVIPTRELINAKVEDIAFLLINIGSQAIQFLFLIGIILGTLRLLFVMIFAIKSKVQKINYIKSPNQFPLVSVIIPAYNEEKVICKTIESLLNSNYKNFNLIVVDDGSKDNTYGKVTEIYRNNSQVQIFTKENRGKAAALNFGIEKTQAEIIITIDADTFFHPDAISKLVQHFTDSNIGAVAGNTKVGNRINLLTRWQALEYITSQNLDRRAYDSLNCILVVPGAIGAWCRNLVLEAGGFTDQTLAEDTDLTISILKMGYRIKYEDSAIAYTEAPDTVSDFFKQRFRWMFGTMQAVWKHRNAWFRPRYKALGNVVIPHTLIFQIFFPLISPIMDLMMIWMLISTIIQKIQHPIDYSTDGLKRVLFYYLFFVALDFLAAFLAFILERKEEWGLLVWLFLQRFYYRQLMYFVAIKATRTAMRGTFVGWGKLERKATVQIKKVI